MNITLPIEEYQEQLTKETIANLAGAALLPEELQVKISETIIKTSLEMAYIKGKYDQLAVRG